MLYRFWVIYLVAVCLYTGFASLYAYLFSSLLVVQTVWKILGSLWVFKHVSSASFALAHFGSLTRSLSLSLSLSISLSGLWWLLGGLRPRCFESWVRYNSWRWRVVGFSFSFKVFPDSCKEYFKLRATNSDCIFVCVGFSVCVCVCVRKIIKN